MTFAGWIEIAVTLALVVGLALPMGAFMAAVFGGERTLLTPILSPVERAFYRLSGIEPEKEQDWLSYTLSMVLFTAGSFVALYLIQRLQAFLPFNSTGRDGVPPNLAFNTAISFITNANWQA